MKRSILLLGVLGALILIGALAYRAAAPPSVIVDVSGIVTSGRVPGRSAEESQEGHLFWSYCTHSKCPHLAVASLTPGGKPVAVAGEFPKPVKGRSRAMHMLGAGDTYAVTYVTPTSVGHQGGPFAEFMLLRTSPNADEYKSFFAATPAGLAAFE